MTTDECDREDCQRIAATASDVYCEITGGLLSYPTYDARTIMAHADDYTQKLIDDETASLDAKIQRIESLIEDWRYKGEFGWGTRQEGEGPDQEGYVLDQCATKIRAALDGEQ